MYERNIVIKRAERETVETRNGSVSSVPQRIAIIRVRVFPTVFVTGIPTTNFENVRTSRVRNI